MQNMNSMINTVEAETQTNIGEDTDAKRTVDVQTEIKDVTGDLSPPPKAHERSLQSHIGFALQNQIDWAYTALCIAVLKKDTDFNKKMEKQVFIETEVDVVLNMLKSKFGEFNRLDMLAPYHLKAHETLAVLCKE